MTLAQLPRNWDYTEELVRPANNLPQTGGFAVFDTAGYYRAYVVPAHRALNVDRIGFHCANVSGSPQVTASIETVSTTTGLDDGLWSASTSGLSGVLTNGYQIVTLDAAASIPMGSIFCPKIAWAAGSLQIRTLAGVNEATEGLPYSIENIGTPTIGGMHGSTFALGNATEWYSIPGFYPCASVTDMAWDSTSGTLKRGLKFVPRFRAELQAVRFVHHPSRLGNFDIVAENSVGTELSRTSVVGDWRREIQRFFERAIADRVTVEKGETYRIFLQPTEVENIHLSRINLPSSDFIRDRQYTEHDGVSWSETDGIPALVPLLRAV